MVTNESVYSKILNNEKAEQTKACISSLQPAETKTDKTEGRRNHLEIMMKKHF